MERFIWVINYEIIIFEYYSFTNHKGIWTNFWTCSKKSPPRTSLHNSSSKCPYYLEQKIKDTKPKL